MRPETVHKEMLSRRLLRVKVVKALYAHFKSESDSLIVSEKNLLFSIDKTYELYHQMLWLIVDVAQYAEKRIELGRKKKLPTPEELNPNTRFIDNPVIAMILFIMPMYAVHKIPAMSRYRGQWSNAFVLAAGCVAFSSLLYKLF